MRILNVRMPIHPPRERRGKDERFTSSPMGLDRDSIDLFHDNLSRASIFARPRDHSSRYLDPLELGFTVYTVSPERAHVANA